MELRYEHVTRLISDGGWSGKEDYHDIERLVVIPAESHASGKAVTVAKLYCGGSIHHHEADRMGRMFAAAPELLWHLKDILGRYEQVVKGDPSRPFQSIESAHATIAKAEG